MSIADTKLQSAPLTFTPLLKSVVWGGTRLKTYKNLTDTTCDTIGESWEISALPEMETVVSAGPYAGKTLSWLANRFGSDLLGTNVTHRYGRYFPLLIKFLDAASDLSVQVHPDDDLALRRHGSMGKTEMWYIIDSLPGSRLYAGFNTPLNRAQYLRHVAEGTLESVLASHPTHPGQVYFLPSGRVHALGAGNLVAEIQESCDITYRIHDYGRLDTDGRPRQLHTELAIDAIDFSSWAEMPLETSPSIPDGRQPGDDAHPTGQTIVDCEHFTTRLIHLTAEPQPLDHSVRSFTVIVCVSGTCIITYPGGTLTVGQGHSVLLPAILTDITVAGPAKILATVCLH